MSLRYVILTKMDEPPPEEVFKDFNPEEFSEEFSKEKNLYKTLESKYTYKDFPELLPYYDKLYNLSLERQILLNPDLYKTLKKQKGKLTQNKKILLARIYGQLKKFENELYSLDLNVLSTLNIKYAVQLKILNTTLYDVAKIKKILTEYEYKVTPFPNIADNEFYKKLESFREAGFPLDAIAELYRMREQIAARLLFASDLRTRFQNLMYDIHKYMEKIRELFENPEELDSLYTQYVFPYF
jgi:hypothetical protein